MCLRHLGSAKLHPSKVRVVEANSPKGTVAPLFVLLLFTSRLLKKPILPAPLAPRRARSHSGLRHRLLQRPSGGSPKMGVPLWGVPSIGYKRGTPFLGNTPLCLGTTFRVLLRHDATVLHRRFTPVACSFDYTIVALSQPLETLNP